MSEVEAKKPQERLQERLALVVDPLQRQRLLEESAARQADDPPAQVADLLRRQNRLELQRRLDELHPADIAHILEALPLEDRLSVWQLVKASATATSSSRFPMRCARR